MHREHARRRRRPIRPPLAAAALLAGGFLAAPPAAVPAAARQAAAPVSRAALLPELQRLARQRGLSFVVEGDARQAREIAVPASGPAADRGDEWDALARRFDYAAERAVGLERVYVLRKRYSRADDMPEITLGEVARSLADIERLTRPFAGDLSAPAANNSEVRNLLASLSPEQTAAMRRQMDRDRARFEQMIALIEPAMAQRGRELPPNARRGPTGVPGNPPVESALPVASLPPAQQTVVRDMVVALYARGTFGAAQYARREAEWLLERGGPTVRWGAVRGDGWYLGFESPFGIAPYVPPRANAAGEKPLGVHPLGPLPTAGTTGAETAPPPPVFPNTRNRAVVSLRDLEAPPASGVAVDPAFGAKRVTVVPSDPDKPLAGQEVARAAAAIYGLRVVSEPDGALLRLEFRRVRPAADAADLRRAVLEALPDPVLRVLTRVEPGAPPPQPPPAPPGPDRAERPDKNAIERQLIRRAETNLADMRARHETEVARLDAPRAAAVRRLRAETNATLPPGSDHALPLSESTEEARKAFAVAYLLHHLKPMDRVVTRPVPRTLTQPDQMYLSGGIFVSSQGTSLFGISVGVPAGSGERLQTEHFVFLPWPQD